MVNPGCQREAVDPEADSNFVLKEFTPAYLATYESGLLTEKIAEALDCLKSCALCPRDCEVDRFNDLRSVCRSGRYARVSSYFAHTGEEDVLRGWNGSGTIFFSWCNLRCVFCQNYAISQRGKGSDVSARELAAMMIRLQEIGCHNINFVTPEHVVPQILEALPKAIEAGLDIPLVYNTSSYDSLHSIELMDGVIDIYMPDFKLWDIEQARKYLLAPDYPETARRAIEAMHRQVDVLRVGEDRFARRGVLVRHLVMPGMLEDTAEIMQFLAGLSRDTYVNVMDQYGPSWKVPNDDRFRDINRRATAGEVSEALQWAVDAGLWRLDYRR